MLITGKRKKSLPVRLTILPKGSTVIPALPIQEDIKDLLIQVGFTPSLNIGETVLPPSKFGPICKYNADGKLVIHKGQPMEKVYRQAEWKWEQWAGRYSTETQTAIVDIPYKRYPRTLIPPPSVELSISQGPDNAKFVVAPPYKIDFQEPAPLLHAINIFLEIFGQCEVLSERLSSYRMDKVVRLNWKILPPGKWPWVRVEKEIKPLIEKEPGQNQVVLGYRLKAITAFQPEFVAVGQAGFSGYLVFGFPQKNLYILESLYFGNATYVFAERWEELSKLTKAEILQGRLQKDRIIHRKPWLKNVRQLLS